MSDVVGDDVVAEPAEADPMVMLKISSEDPEPNMVIPPDMAERDYVTVATCFGTAEERAAGWVLFDASTAQKTMTAWELAQIMRIRIELPMHIAKAVLGDEKVARHFKVMP